VVLKVDEGTNVKITFTLASVSQVLAESDSTAAGERSA